MYQGRLPWDSKLIHFPKKHNIFVTIISHRNDSVSLSKLLKSLQPLFTTGKFY